MPTGRTARILVVDDNEVLRSLLVRALSEDGYEVVAVPPGADGSAAGTYDLIITGEHAAPPMDGMVRTGKAGGPPSPTLHLDELSRGNLMAERPLGYQPFRIEALLDRVRRRLDEHQAE